MHQSAVLSPYITLNQLQETTPVLVLRYQLKTETRAQEELRQRENWLARVPEWVADHDVTGCMVCAREFSFRLRRHHCRRCGKVVCGKCSEARRFIPQLGFTRAKVRVCDHCTLLTN